MIAVSLAIGIGLTWVWISSRVSDEPLHKGKPISYWIDHASRPHPSNFCGEVREIGSRAIPFLIEKLRTRDTWFRRARIALYQKLPSPVQDRLPEIEDAPSVQYGAAACLSLFGSEAKAAVPELIKLLDNKGTVTQPFASALGSIGPAAKDALPALKNALATADLYGQVTIAWAIARIDRDTNLVLNVCTKAIDRTSSDSTTIIASQVLQELGPIAGAVTSKLVQLLQNPTRSPDARGAAARTLGGIGLRSEPVLTALKTGLHDSALPVRANCAIALWRLDSQYAPLAVPVVVEWVIALNKQRTSKIDLTEFATLEQLDFRDAIVPLKVLINSDSSEVRQFAADESKKIEARTAGQ